MDRREFVAVSLCAGASLAANPEPRVETVLGSVPASELGFTLPHEHVMCDFAGAALTSPARWVAAQVVATMEPYLAALAQRGVRSFVDCTPAYIGRDPRVLRALAQATGLHIVTNCGYYGAGAGKYLPAHAHTETAEQLAERWVAECRQGIDDTGIRPGFIKIGVNGASGDPPTLSPVDARLVRAGAMASRQTGRSVTCHTGGAAAGLAAVKVFVAEGGDATRLVIAHADGHGRDANLAVAESGAWVSFDAAGSRPVAAHAADIMALLARHADRVLLSSDAGWYWVGEPGGGKVRDYGAVTDLLLPALRAAGLDDAVAQQITVSNPAHVFGLRTTL